MKPPSSCLDTKTRRIGAGLPSHCRVPVRAIVCSHRQPLTLSNTRVSLEALVLCIPLWPHLPDSSPLTSVFTPSPVLLTSNARASVFSLLRRPRALHLSFLSLGFTCSAIVLTCPDKHPPWPHPAKPQTVSHLLRACSQMAECG